MLNRTKGYTGWQKCQINKHADTIIWQSRVQEHISAKCESQFFFSLHCISKLCQLNDGHFVQTLTYVKHWRALNHKAIMNQWNCYKREQVTLNEELDFFCIHWNDCCGSRAVRQMTWQMTWCWTISIYSADPHIRKVSFQPKLYSIYLSIKLIMHKHVQLLILIGKPCFFKWQQWILKHS